jgi:hypothetical protein
MMEIIKEVFTMKIFVFVMLFCTLYIVMKALELADAPFDEEFE